jgi:hypothetical protein
MMKGTYRPRVTSRWLQKGVDIGYLLNRVIMPMLSLRQRCLQPGLYSLVGWKDPLLDVGKREQHHAVAQGNLFQVRVGN